MQRAGLDRFARQPRAVQEEQRSDRHIGDIVHDRCSGARDGQQRGKRDRAQQCKSEGIDAQSRQPMFDHGVKLGQGSVQCNLHCRVSCSPRHRACRGAALTCAHHASRFEITCRSQCAQPGIATFIQHLHTARSCRRPLRQWSQVIGRLLSTARKGVSCPTIDFNGHSRCRAWPIGSARARARNPCCRRTASKC